jgi:hypothetical protein
VRFRRVVPSIVAPAIVLAGLAGVAAFQTSPAQATAVTGLPITSVYQVVADTAHGHLFISQGPDAGTNAPVVVTNLSGTPITTIGDGARGLALSANDETLYAATGDTVSAFSTTTLKETGSYPTPGTAWQVALQSGRLWVSYQDDSSGKVGAIDLADPSTPWDSVPGQWIEWPPVIAVDPSDKGVLVTSSVGTNEPVTASYNVSDPSAVTLINSATSTGCGNNGLSVLPGGKTFLCDGYPYSTATLAPQDPSGTYATGFTEVAPDGAIAAGIGGSANGVVWAYPAGSTTPTASYEGWDRLPLPSSFVVSASAPVDFAWSASSQQLFTIIESWSNDSDSNPVYTLLSLYPFEKVPADLTLTSTATTVQYGAPATITAHLGFTYSNQSISVYVAPAGEPRFLDWSGAPNDPSGNVTFPVPSFTRNETVTAVFTGDPHYAPATVNLTIRVGVKIATAAGGYYKTIKVSGIAYRVYHHTATLKDLVTVAPVKPGECVRLQVQQAIHGVWRADATTGCAALNKRSQAMITRKLGPTGWFRVRADFTPSAKDTANVSTDGAWLYYEVTR